MNTIETYGLQNLNLKPKYDTFQFSHQMAAPTKKDSMNIKRQIISEYIFEPGLPTETKEHRLTLSLQHVPT